MKWKLYECKRRQDFILVDGVCIGRMDIWNPSGARMSVPDEGYLERYGFELAQDWVALVKDDRFHVVKLNAVDAIKYALLVRGCTAICNDQERLDSAMAGTLYQEQRGCKS